MKPPPPPSELECVHDPARATVLLHPTRREVLARALEPTSATEIAGHIGLTRQKVNYHVRELARAGFLRPAGRRKKRNLTEQRWVATARSYVIAPEVVGLLAPATDDDAEAGRRRRVEDKLSAAWLLALASKVLSELGRAMRGAAAEGKRLSTLALDTELRFESAEQRARFAAALTDAVGEVVARHASPATRADGSPAPGRPYRLVLGCYPTPPREARTEEEDPR